MMASRSHDEHERADSLLSALERQLASRAVHFVPPWDHFLDYVLLCAILIGYGLMLPEGSQHLMTWTVAS
jgi:hypothetical protein